MQGGYQEENGIEQIVEVVMVSRPGPQNKVIHVPPALLAFQTQEAFVARA